MRGTVKAEPADGFRYVQGLKKQWQEGGPERTEEGGHRKGYSWSQDRRVCAHGNVSHLPVQIRGNKTDPWTIKLDTQGSQRETISRSRIKWAEGKGLATI